MSWRDWFKAPPAAPPEHDARLGTLSWVDEQDGWCGSLDGLKFVLVHDRQSHPPEELKAWAWQVLQDREGLDRSLAEAVRNAPSRYERYRDEMAALRYDELSFAIQSQGRLVFATLEPGGVGRFWRLEFFNGACRGIGFDS